MNLSLSHILKEHAEMMIVDARHRKRALRQRIRDLMPCQSHPGVRGPNDRPKHLWVFYTRAKRNHERASQMAAVFFSEFRNQITN